MIIQDWVPPALQTLVARPRSCRDIGCITADVAPRHGAGTPLVKDEILYSLASIADVVAGLLKR
jgi:hypothetical protein